MASCVIVSFYVLVSGVFGWLWRHAGTQSLSLGSDIPLITLRGPWPEHLLTVDRTFVFSCEFPRSFCVFYSQAIRKKMGGGAERKETKLIFVIEI